MYRIQWSDEYIGSISSKFCYRERLNDAQVVFNDYKRIIDELYRRQSEQYVDVESKSLKPLHRYSVHLYRVNTISANNDELIDSYVL